MHRYIHTNCKLHVPAPQSTLPASKYNKACRMVTSQVACYAPGGEFSVRMLYSDASYSASLWKLTSASSVGQGSKQEKQRARATPCLGAAERYPKARRDLHQPTHREYGESLGAMQLRVTWCMLPPHTSPTIFLDSRCHSKRNIWSRQLLAMPTGLVSRRGS